MGLGRVQTAFRIPLSPQAQRARVELLAPAGSFDSLVAAVENGADAVYLAGQHFGARKFAKNFTDDEMRAGIDFAHVRGVKVFVVVNTLVFNEEFQDVVPFLALVREAGADAIIVQDLGVMRVLRGLYPDLPLHISTQATVHNAKGVRFLEDLGAERAILAREMTLKDIAGMKQKTGASTKPATEAEASSRARTGHGSGVELETFVHGALCYCYSGQCLMSSVIGERSGNRGACAYTCRLPFDMVEGQAKMPEVEQKHVLSSKDLNQIDSIPKLIEAGVTSFKIEGRMKRPEYVAVVTRAYRTAIDRYYAGDFHVTPEEHRAVMAVFNREFTPGYLEGKEKWGFTSWDTDGNRGTPLGEVVEAGRGYVRVKLFDHLRVKDGISVVHLPTWGRGNDPADPAGAAPRASFVMRNDEPEEYGFTVSQIDHGGRWVTEATPGMIVSLKGHAKASVGDKVYKTADSETLDAARATFQGPPLRRVGVETTVRLAEGQPIAVTMRDHERDVSIEHRSSYVVAAARKAPVTERAVRDQFEKMNETVFEHDRLDVHVEGAVFAPISELNDARRGAVDALSRAIAARWHRAPLADLASKAATLLALPDVPRGAQTVRVAVNAWGLENVRAALEGGAESVYFSGLKVGGLQPRWDEEAVLEAARLAEAAGARFYLASGMIQKDWEVEALRDASKLVRASPAFAGILAGNHGACQVAIEEGLLWIADWPMNVYNSVTTDFLVQHGAERITLSPELTMEQMADVARHTHAPLEALVHGRLTLMTSEYCSIGHATACQMPGGTWAPCHDTDYSLEDRLGKRFPLATDGACRMYILNSVELAMANRIPDLAGVGLDVLRIESIGTKPDALREQVRIYKAAVDAWNRDRAGYHFPKSQWKALETTCPDGFTTGHFYRGPA